MDLNKIGKLIHDLRTEKGMSQSKLAEMIPITRQAVSRWEQGKSLPDSQTLIILSEIFEISVDEILAGKRNSPEEKAKVTLDLVDEYNNKKRMIRKITIISLLTICLLLILFLGYYFFNSYNSIKVYKVNGVGDNFISKDGIMIVTKQKTYLRLGELRKKNNDKEIERVKLYFVDKNGNEKVLYEDDKTDILITSYYGYDNIFSDNELEYIKRDLNLEIEYEDHKEVIRMKIEKDFSNNLWFYNRKDDITNNRNVEDSTPLIHDKIKLSMEEKGTKEENVYHYEVEEGDKIIKFNYTDSILLLEITSKDYKESWNCIFNNGFSFTYTKFIDNVENKRRNIIIDSKQKISSDDNKIYKSFLAYVNKYLIN